MSLDDLGILPTLYYAHDGCTCPYVCLVLVNIVFYKFKTWLKSVKELKIYIKNRLHLMHIKARADNEVVNDTFLVNNRPASVLFDSGADRSFVSLSFEPLLATPRTKLRKPLSVEVATGKPLVLDSIFVVVN